MDNQCSQDQEEEELWALATRENIESLPKVSLRILLYALLGSLALSISWLSFAQFEEIASVIGQLEPKSKVTVIDSPIAGKVKSIKIQPGKTVKVNQILLSLDSQLTLIEQQQQQIKLKIQQEKLKRAKLSKQRSIELLQAAITDQFKGEKAEKQAQIEQTQTLIKTKISELTEAKINLAAASGQWQRYQKAELQGVLSQDLLAIARQRLGQERQNVIQAKTALAEAQSLYVEKISSQKTLINGQKIKVLEAQEQIKQLNVEILTLKADIQQNQSLLKSLNYQIKSDTITSPIEGVILEQSINTLGKVVAQGEALVTIAPKRSPIIFRGYVKTKDSGFLKLGMPAKIKLDAFPWREFGVIVGKVIWISPDSESDDNNQKFYKIEIEFKQDNQLKSNLTLGQTGKAEIIVRKKNIINLLTETLGYKPRP